MSRESTWRGCVIHSFSSPFILPCVAVTSSVRSQKGLKTSRSSRYTAAAIAPIISGISFALVLLMSLPFRPALRNDGPAHRTIANVAEKARPEKAREVIRCCSSPWDVFAATARHAAERVRRVHDSVRLSVAVILFVFAFSMCVRTGSLYRDPRVKEKWPYHEMFVLFAGGSGRQKA